MHESDAPVRALTANTGQAVLVQRIGNELMPRRTKLRW